MMRHGTILSLQAFHTFAKDSPFLFSPWQPSSHLLQHMEFASFEADAANERWSGPPGLRSLPALLTRVQCLGRRRDHPGGVNPRNLDAVTSGWANQTQITPNAHGLLQRGQPA